MKKLTTTEIARLAGVSRSTVSRVVNGYDNVPDATRDRVMKVINENSYYPMLSGQLLAGKKTKTLGFFWAANGKIANDMLCSAFFVHVTECAAELGYLVLTCIVPNLKDAENIDWVRRVFLQGRIDAGIFIGVDDNEPLVEELIAMDYIVGIFDHSPYGRDEHNRISVNFETNTGEKAIEYLYALGHRKIAVIDGNMSRYSFLNRHESYVAAMRRCNISIRGEWMHYAYVGGSDGYQATRDMLARCGELPTAICAANDGVAFGIYDALNEANIRIPEQISVIGIDGHPETAFLSPPLTTFAFNFRDIFYSLVKRTIDAVEEAEDTPRTEYISSVLHERGSCKNLAE